MSPPALEFTLLNLRLLNLLNFVEFTFTVTSHLGSDTVHLLVVHDWWWALYLSLHMDMQYLQDSLDQHATLYIMRAIWELTCFLVSVDMSGIWKPVLYLRRQRRGSAFGGATPHAVWIRLLAELYFQLGGGF